MYLRNDELVVGSNQYLVSIISRVLHNGFRDINKNLVKELYLTLLLKYILLEKIKNEKKTVDVFYETEALKLAHLDSVFVIHSRYSSNLYYTW